MPVIHPLDEVNMGDKALYDLDLVAGCYYQQLQVQLFAELHQIGSFFFILVAKAFVYGDEAKAF